MVSADTPGVAIQLSRGVVVASIQVDLDDDVMARFREDLLGRLRQTGAPAVILDVSGLETLDATEFVTLRQLITMARLMGAETVIAGLRPGVVSALITAGAEVDGVRAALDIDAAFAELEPDEPGTPGPGAAVAEEAADAADADTAEPPA